MVEIFELGDEYSTVRQMPHLAVYDESTGFKRYRWHSADQIDGKSE